MDFFELSTDNPNKIPYGDVKPGIGGEINEVYFSDLQMTAFSIILKSVLVLKLKKKKQSRDNQETIESIREVLNCSKKWLQIHHVDQFQATMEKIGEISKYTKANKIRLFKNLDCQSFKDLKCMKLI